MTSKKTPGQSPSEFYRARRPEYFSDSETVYETRLPREHLAFELSKISTNQKHDEFETLGRRFAEKFISPNLIPQVGPTGGGDGKTDTETYPVSDEISSRWFTPENGWEKDEKWAFAISAKEDWKSKLNGDVKKIVDTRRGYSRVYFISNQLISSRKKKESQDELKALYEIDIVILDAEWILEKTYSSDLIDLVVDSLNLSDSLKKKTKSLGRNDFDREEKLAELERKISATNRYSETDFQLVEDALQAAILSRMIEKPRDEVIGKFERAIRFCKKVNIDKQWIKIHYQMAWTYIHWYDDYGLFFEEFKKFKVYISSSSGTTEVEYYFNLMNVMRGITGSGNCDPKEFSVDLSKENQELDAILASIEGNKDRPSSGLICKTYRCLNRLMNSLSDSKIGEAELMKIKLCISSSVGFIDYPFEDFKNIIQELGLVFPNNKVYDELIDVIADTSEKRNSELAAGETFLRRAAQKLSSNFHKESIVYFGKSVLKLAKEESRDKLYLALTGLAQAYSSLDLIYASNNSLISATSIAFQSWHDNRILDERTLYCVEQLAKNELFLGRLPCFLMWNELYSIISSQLKQESPSKEGTGEIPVAMLIDSCLAVRLLTWAKIDTGGYSLLPDLLMSQSLDVAKACVLYRLGYVDLIKEEFNSAGITSETQMNEYFESVASQPFREQMLYETEFLSEEQVVLKSKILGCTFQMHFGANKNMFFAAEMFLAYLEGFFATSLSTAVPSAEIVDIYLIDRTAGGELFNAEQGASSGIFRVYLNISTFINEGHKFKIKLVEFVGLLLSKIFFVQNMEEYLDNIFRNEEVHERLGLVLAHKTFSTNVLGVDPKIFYSSWITDKSFKIYPINRTEPLTFTYKPRVDSTAERAKKDHDSLGHGKRNVISIIDVPLWDEAQWRAFGCFGDNSQMTVFLGFLHIDAGKKIFDDWLKRFGKVDKDEQIKITIVKGVDSKHPNWYRVHIAANFVPTAFVEGNIYVTPSRFHEMNADSSQNLNDLLKGYQRLGSYRLCPGKVDMSGRLEPYFDKSITKSSLNVRHAWEIGLNDLDSVVIKPDDEPIIPATENNAPILELLKTKRKKD